MKVLKFFIGFLIICAFTMFATANLEKVQVNFLFDSQPLLGYKTIEVSHPDGSTTPVQEPRKVPLFILIFFSFGFGFLVSWILSAGLVRKNKKQVKKLSKENNAMHRELNELRNLPVNSPSDSSVEAIETSDKKSLPVD